MVACALLGALAPACGKSGDDKVSGWPPPRGELYEPDTEPVDTEEPDTWEPPDTEARAADTLEDTPCAWLVALACDLYGPWSDPCSEARAHPPDDDHAPTRTRCEELVKHFTEVELGRVGGACYRYARALCKGEGHESAQCKKALGRAPRLPALAQKRACLGDLLIYEARDLRHR